jgi:hypothetical protein
MSAVSTESDWRHAAAVVHQAIGVLTQRHETTPDLAAASLVATAEEAGRDINAVAADIVRSATTTKDADKA